LQLSVLPLIIANVLTSSTPAPAATQSPCTTPQYRQFDFWLGNWRVVDPKGKPAGTNLVTSVYGGCALQEHWKGVGGDQGSSFNIYNTATKHWHQTWVDNSGTLLVLDGESPNPGVMVLTGPRHTRRGTIVIDRITWTKLDENRVRQLWDYSSDGGKKWAVVFDGTYLRQPASPT
jgi:hypothetical protein